MKKTKPVLFVVLYFITFFVVETIASAVAIFYRLYTDQVYAERLADALYSVDYSDMESVTNYLNVIYEMVPQVLLLSGIFALVPITIYFIKTKQNPYEKIEPPKIVFLIGFAITMNVVISTLIEFLPSDLISNYTQSTGYVEQLPFWSLLLTVGIIGPITEEIFFRYLMMKRINNKYLAIILPALMFGVAHGNIVQGTYAFIIGLIFGYVYYKTKNLSYSTIMHIAVNSSSVFIVSMPKGLAVIIGILLFAYTAIYLFHVYDSKTKIFV